MTKFKRTGFIVSGLFVLLAPFKLAFSKSPNELSQKLKDSQKKLELNYKVMSGVDLEKILEENIENLSDEEKNTLILKLLEISNSTFHMQNMDSALDKEYLDAKGSFSFKG